MCLSFIERHSRLILETHLFLLHKNPSTSSLSLAQLDNPLPLLLGVLGPQPHHLLQRLDALHHLSKEDVRNTMKLKKE